MISGNMGICAPPCGGGDSFPALSGNCRTTRCPPLPDGHCPVSGLAAAMRPSLRCFPCSFSCCLPPLFSCTSPPPSILFHYLRLPGWQSVRNPLPLREAGWGVGPPRAGTAGGSKARQKTKGREKEKGKGQTKSAAAGNASCKCRRQKLSRGEGMRNRRNSPYCGAPPPENSETLCNALGSTETSRTVFLYPKHYNLSIIAANRPYRDMVLTRHIILPE